MNEVFILRGFDSESIEKVKNLLSSLGSNLSEMVFQRASTAMLDENVEALLTRLDTSGSTSVEQKNEATGSQTVIMGVGSKEQALKVMRSFKSVVDKPGSAAFAMVTQTSMKWTLGYYMNHVNEEHEYMKTHNPGDDPDMKKID